PVSTFCARLETTLRVQPQWQALGQLSSCLPPAWVPQQEIQLPPSLKSHPIPDWLPECPTLSMSTQDPSFPVSAPSKKWARRFWSSRLKLPVDGGRRRAISCSRRML